MNAESHKCPPPRPSRPPSFRSMFLDLHIWAQWRIPLQTFPCLTLSRASPCSLSSTFGASVVCISYFPGSAPFPVAVTKDPSWGILKRSIFASWFLMFFFLSRNIRGHSTHRCWPCCVITCGKTEQASKRQCFSNKATPLATQSPLIPE